MDSVTAYPHVSLIVKKEIFAILYVTIQKKTWRMNLKKLADYASFFIHSNISFLTIKSSLENWKEQKFSDLIWNFPSSYICQNQNDLVLLLKFSNLCLSFHVRSTILVYPFCLRMPSMLMCLTNVKFLNNLNSECRRTYFWQNSLRNFTANSGEI